MTAAKQIPIIFSGESVRAILAGLKTETRRVITRRSCEPMPKWKWDRLEFDDSKVPETAMQTFADNGYLHVATWPHPDDPLDGENWTRERIYPRVQVGDTLWVRETFWEDSRVNYSKPPCEVYYDATPEIAMDPFGRVIQATYIDGNNVPPEASLHNLEGNRFWSKTSSSRMPRWASRLTLKVTNVRVEQPWAWITEFEKIET
jgi:hypothetical protein